MRTEGHRFCLSPTPFYRRFSHYAPPFPVNNLDFRVGLEHLVSFDMLCGRTTLGPFPCQVIKGLASLCPPSTPSNESVLASLRSTTLSHPPPRKVIHRNGPFYRRFLIYTKNLSDPVPAPLRDFQPRFKPSPSQPCIFRTFHDVLVLTVFHDCIRPSTSRLEYIVLSQRFPDFPFWFLVASENPLLSPTAFSFFFGFKRPACLELPPPIPGFFSLIFPILFSFLHYV